MKAFKFLILIWLVGCIQTDLEDPFTPTLQIDNEISNVVFRVNGSYPLSAVYKDDTGEPTEVSIEWESSDDATLSFDGNIANPHREGLVLITATFDGLSETFPVEVLASREMISISGFISLKQVGTSAALTANYIDPDGKTTPVNVNWSSSNTGVATIDENGQVNAIAIGTSDITASFNTVSSMMSLEVIAGEVMQDPIIRITKFAMFLNEGEQFQFEADYINDSGILDENASISWSSSNESVISINSNGLATANAVGTSTITASSQNISTSIDMEIEGSNVEERTGSLMGTGYDIEGDFVLSENEAGDLILTITNYKPDGPGPYFYLSNINEPRQVDGINLGDASTSGDITINVSEIDENATLLTYDFLVIWCQPFGVRLGVGEFEN